MSEVACVDLFCGAGGLTHGLLRSGINVVAGIDVDTACRFPFEANNGARFLAKDINSVKHADLKKLYGDARIRILAGCAPCQPFSAYSQRYDTLTSPRWPLLYQFARLVKSVRPDIVTMENVPLVEKHAVFDDFVILTRNAHGCRNDRRNGLHSRRDNTGATPSPFTFRACGIFQLPGTFH